MTRSTTTSTTTATPPAPSAPADRLRALAGEQLARDRWSRDQLLAYQGERLRALIAHAVAGSPYYREVLGPDAASGDVPLRELPTLPKATLMDNFDRIVTDPRLRRADLEAHLAGPGPDQPYLGGTGCSAPRAPPGCAGCSWRTPTSSRSGSAPACGAWPAGAWGRRPGWPGSAPRARCTSPTRSTPCCWPGRPAPPRAWPSPPPCPRWWRA